MNNMIKVGDRVKFKNCDRPGCARVGAQPVATNKGFDDIAIGTPAVVTNVHLECGELEVMVKVGRKNVMLMHVDQVELA